MRPRRYLYALAPIAMAAFVCAAVVVAVAVTLSPAFLAFRDDGTIAPGFGAWRALAEVPGIGSAVALTFAAGTIATLASLVVACCVGAWAMTRRRRAWALVVSAGVAAIPIAALGTGMSDLASLAAATSTAAWWPRWLPGVHAGTAMLPIALFLKIAPFLVAIVLITMTHVAADGHATVAATLGYGRGEIFAKLVLPQIYPRLRLPVCAALAWSLSAVATALLVDPANRSRLAVIAWHDIANGGGAQRALGAATAAVVLVVAVAAIALLTALESIARRVGNAWLRSGRYGSAAGAITGLGVAAAGAGLVLVAAALVVPWTVGPTSGATSLAPAATIGGDVGGSAHDAAAALVATLAIAVAATLVALAATVVCLEAEDRNRWRSGWPALLWAPWLVPQIALVPGIAWIVSGLGIRAPLAAAIVAQLVFVLPCVALALVPAWRAIDPRYARCAAALRAAPWRVLARVKLPLVARPTAFACALGFAVSAGLFLPTRLTVGDREAMLLLALVPAVVVAFTVHHRARRAAPASLAAQAAVG